MPHFMNESGNKRRKCLSRNAAQEIGVKAYDSTMKKSFLLFAILGFLAATAFSQGTVNFNNLGLGPSLSFLVYYERGVPLVGTNFVAQLYYGHPGSEEGSLIPVASPPAPFREATTSFPGTWRGGSRSLMGFYNNGGPNDPITVLLQVRVWDITLGPDYRTAFESGNGFNTGKSAPFIYFVPRAGAPPAAFLMSNFTGFSIVIPEPSTYLLFSLGLLVSFFFRGFARK